MTKYSRPAPIVVTDWVNQRTKIVDRDYFVRMGGLCPCYNGGWTYRNPDFLESLPKMSDVSPEPEPVQRDTIVSVIRDRLRKLYWW